VLMKLIYGERENAADTGKSVEASSFPASSISRMLPESTSSTIKSTSPNLSRPSRNPTQAQAPAPLDSHAFKIPVLKGRNLL